MSTIDFTLPNEFNDVYDLSIHVGTITNIHYDTDLADITIEGNPYADVPIFYHCPNETTITGGSAAFENGDQVYVISKEGICPPSQPNLKIVGRVSGLNECMRNIFLFNDLGDIYEKEKISCTAVQNWRPQIFVTWGATYIDESNDYFAIYESTSKYVRLYRNLRNGPPSSLLTLWPPPTPNNQAYALTYDGANIILCREKVGDSTKTIIYIMQGWTNVINYQFEITGWIWSMTFDGTNLIVGGREFTGGGWIGKVWKLNGISASILDSFQWPPSPLNATRGPECMAIYKGNLISWGGYHTVGISSVSYDYLTLHSGFSDTITSQCPISPGGLLTFNGLIYPKLP